MYDCKFEWPNGAHIAVVFNMSWETWPDTLATAENKESGNEKVPATAKYSRGMRWIYEHAYGETGGMQRLLDMWQRHGIKTSCYADGHTVKLFPDLARKVAADGHEFIVQGWNHDFLWNMTVAQQAETIDTTVAEFATIGVKAAGFSSAGGHLTAESVPLLVERGFKYICGKRNADVPFVIDWAGKKIVGMTSYAISDFRTHGGGITPRQVIEMYKDCFDAMYEEGRRGYPQMLPYGTHPFIAAGHRTKPVEELIAYVKGKPGVWITTRGEIAEWMLTRYPDYTLAKFFPEAVASDRHYGLSIGLGGEQAQAEARKYRRVP